MSVDVLTYESLGHAEQSLFQTESVHDIGRFGAGVELSQRIGDGLEIDGLRPYQPGDDARHIDWVETAKQPDGALLLRQHYADQAPLTVLVSDIPTHERYYRTPGGPLGSRALGLVAIRLLIKQSCMQSSPVSAYWSDGFKLHSANGRVFEGPQSAKKIVNNGLELANASTERFQQNRDVSSKRGLFKRGSAAEVLQRRNLGELISSAHSHTRQIADAARFIIVSDFRSDTDDVLDAIKAIQKRSDVLALQITNPLLRELPSTYDRIETGRSKASIVESDAQREAYRVMAAERQRSIDERLAKWTSKTVTIDTTDPRLGRIA